VSCSVAPWALALTWPAIGWALDPAKAITQYGHRRWATDHTILQTRDGYLSLGTQEGLVRFDGVRFVVFDKANTPEIRNNGIFKLLEGRRGDLWIATAGGLVRMRRGAFRAFGAEDGLPGSAVTALHEDRDGIPRKLKSATSTPAA
jgi:ligand-binding sensor domain-containing protein